MMINKLLTWAKNLFKVGCSVTQCGLWPIGIHRDYDDVQLYNYINGPISLYSKNLMLKCSHCILNNETLDIIEKKLKKIMIVRSKKLNYRRIKSEKNTKKQSISEAQNSQVVLCG